MTHLDPPGHDTWRSRCGLQAILWGFLLILLVAVGAMWRWTAAADVAAVTGVTAGLVGTVVGAFLGAHAGAAGLEQVERARRDAETARARAEMRALRLAGSLEPGRAMSLLAGDNS
jgi:hypothetical protein